MYPSIRLRRGLTVLDQFALIIKWVIGPWESWCLYDSSQIPDIGDKTDTTPTRLAPPTLRPIELSARRLWCLYVIIERPGGLTDRVKSPI